jgi:hypothetical protein
MPNLPWVIFFETFESGIPYQSPLLDSLVVQVINDELTV